MTEEKRKNPPGTVIDVPVGTEYRSRPVLRWQREPPDEAGDWLGAKKIDHKIFVINFYFSEVDFVRAARFPGYFAWAKIELPPGEWEVPDPACASETPIEGAGGPGEVDGG